MIRITDLKSSYGFSFGILLIVLTLLLGACTKPAHEKPKPNIQAKSDNPKAPLTDVRAEWKLPIFIPEGEFYRIAGWLSDTEVVYITNRGQTSNVYQYDLVNGKSEIVYKSGNPIVTVQISPSREYLLIHSSPSSYEGVITIIDAKGTKVHRLSIPSYELVFEWNPYDESKVLISKFNEDWTFQVLLLDLKDSKTTDLSLPQPFLKWIDEKEIAFLNWDDDNPALSAPLMVKGLGDQLEKTVLQSVFQFSAFQTLLMSVTVEEQNKTNAVYSIFDKKFKELYTFSSPVLSRYSDWLIPFYDYNEKMGKFITFRPVENGEADSYRKGFELVLYGLERGDSSLILDELENEPIAFSPSGEALLYGNHFEKIINLKSKKIIELVKE